VHVGCDLPALSAAAPAAGSSARAAAIKEMDAETREVIGDDVR